MSRAIEKKIARARDKLAERGYPKLIAMDPIYDDAAKGKRERAQDLIGCIIRCSDEDGEITARTTVYYPDEWRKQA